MGTLIASSATNRTKAKLRSSLALAVMRRKRRRLPPKNRHNIARALRAMTRITLAPPKLAVEPAIKQNVLAATKAPSNKHKKCTSCHQQHQFQRVASVCLNCHKADQRAPHDGACLKCHQAHGPRRGPSSTVAVVISRCLRFTANTPPALVATRRTSPPRVVRSVCRATPLNSRCHPMEARPPSTMSNLPQSARTVAGQAVRRMPRTIAANPLFKGHRCQGCHNPHQAPAPWFSRCEQCHVSEAAGIRGLPGTHATCKGCHEPHSNRLPACQSCHQSRPGSHATEGHQKCRSCHETHAVQVQGRAKCMTCHADKKDHFPAAAQCAACHLFK